MVWLNPSDHSKGIAPLEYTIANNSYKRQISSALEERKSEMDSCLDEVRTMGRNCTGWWISGAVSVDLWTGDYSRLHTNLDIAIIRNMNTLNSLVEEGKERNLFLFKKLRSYKLSRKDPVKYEVFWPITKNKTARLISNYRKNLNLQFCRVDRFGQIIPEDNPKTRIKIYLHHFDSESRLISSEGDFGIKEIPVDFLSNTPFFPPASPENRFSSNNYPIYIVDINYSKLLKEKMLSHWRWKRNPKHRQDLNRILSYLKKNPPPLPQPLVLLSFPSPSPSPNN